MNPKPSQTFRAYFLLLEGGMLVLTVAILFAGIWGTVEWVNRHYLKLRLLDADKVHLFLEGRLTESRQRLEAFAALPAAERAVAAQTLLADYADLYWLNEELRVDYVYKAVASSRVFPGFDFSGGKLGRYLHTDVGDSVFSEVMRGYEDDNPSIYYAYRQNTQLYLGRINLAYMQDFMTQYARASGAPLLLVAPDGFVMATSDPALGLYSFDLQQWSGGPSPRQTLLVGGRRWIPVISDQRTMGAKVAVLVPTDLPNILGWSLGIFGLVFLGGLMTLAVIKNQRIEKFVLRPISHLTHKLQALEDGHLAQDSTSYRFAELQSIHTRFQTMAQAIAAREQSLRASEARANEMAQRLETANQVLRDSEERFRLAFENANVGMCLVDTAGRLFKVNRQLCEMFGYDATELTGMTVNDIAHPDYLEISPTFIHHATAGAGDHTAFEKAYIHKQGHLVWGRVASSLVRDSAGNPLYFISHVQDITERKQAEAQKEAALAELQQAYRRLDDIIDFLPDATFVVDCAGRVIAWNRAMEVMMGVPKSAILGKGDQEYALAFYGERRLMLIDLALLPEAAFTEEYAQDVQRKDDLLFAEAEIPRIYGGRGGYLWGTATPLRNTAGEIIGAIESIRDISDLKETERQLQQAKEEAEQANRAKSMFLANMSHELRTPPQRHPRLLRIAGSRRQSHAPATTKPGND